MISKLDTPVAIIHRAPLKVDEDPSRIPEQGISPELRSMLQDSGIDTHFTRGLSAYGQDGEISTWYKNNDGVYVHGKVAIDRVVAIRDMAGGFNGSKGALTASAMPEVAILNGSNVRIGDDKAYMTSEGIFGVWQAETVLIEVRISSDQLKAKVYELAGGGVVYAKPSISAAGKGVFRIDPNSQDYNDVLDLVIENWPKEGRSYLLQKEINNRGPLPSTIELLDEENKACLDAIADGQKELRIFWFYGSGLEPVCIPIIKVKPFVVNIGKDGKTVPYISIKPETVPDELIEFTKEILKSFAGRVAATEMSGAFDFAYGTSGSDTEPRWYIMEGNFWQPVPPNKSENADIRRDFIKATSDQIARITQSRIDGI